MNKKDKDPAVSAASDKDDLMSKLNSLQVDKGDSDLDFSDSEHASDEESSS